jgi:hypothetical protein
MAGARNREHHLPMLAEVGAGQAFGIGRRRDTDRGRAQPDSLVNHAALKPLAVRCAQRAVADSSFQANAAVHWMATERSLVDGSTKFAETKLRY